MSNPLKVHIVEHARALIASEAHWCRGQIAQDPDGLAVCATDPNASKFCAYGALVVAAHHLTNDCRQAYELASGMVSYFGGSSALVEVNDTQGHAAVLALFDEVRRSL